jgi:hypothetical protein
MIVGTFRRISALRRPTFTALSRCFRKHQTLSQNCFKGEPSYARHGAWIPRPEVHDFIPSISGANSECSRSRRHTLTDIEYMIEEETEPVRAKMNFDEPFIASIMEVSGASRSHVDALIKLMNFEFVAARVRENLVNNPPGPEVILDTWTEAMYLEECKLKRRRGRPAHEALLHVFYMTGLWWAELPPRNGKRRPKWKPEFYRERDGKTLPANDMGELLLIVARACHPAYTGANCSAVADRARLDARSPESKLKRKARNAKDVAAHRAKSVYATGKAPKVQRD